MPATFSSSHTDAGCEALHVLAQSSMNSSLESTSMLFTLGQLMLHMSAAAPMRGSFDKFLQFLQFLLGLPVLDRHRLFEGLQV